MKSSRKARRKLNKQNIKQAIRIEVREHRSSFIIFCILQILVFITFIRHAMRGDFESLFFCALTYILLYVPSWLQVRLRIEIPPLLEICILCFIFAAEILGEVNAFYVRIPGWDTMLHTINGFLAAAVGLSTVVLLNDNENLTFELSPLFLALVAFCFSMTIGVLWEFFEFGMDRYFCLDMQKDSIVNVINSVKLDPTLTNSVVSIKNITDVSVNGESLGLGGYLDIGIVDTMKDLWVNFIGAVVFSVIGFFHAKGKGNKVKSIMPSKKNDKTDYLRQIRENNK